MCLIYFHSLKRIGLHRTLGPQFSEAWVRWKDTGQIRQARETAPPLVAKPICGGLAVIPSPGCQGRGEEKKGSGWSEGACGSTPHRVQRDLRPPNRDSCPCRPRGGDKEPQALCPGAAGSWLEKEGPDPVRMLERGLDWKDVQSQGGSPRSPPALVAASAANPAGGGPRSVGHAADAKASPSTSRPMRPGSWRTAKIQGVDKLLSRLARSASQLPSLSQLLAVDRPGDLTLRFQSRRSFPRD